MVYKVTRLLLWIGAFLFLFEAVIHFFGLPILEHDKIFLPTHDRYIALFALNYAILLILISTDLKKYEVLFKLTMVSILLAMGIAAFIAYSGGYAHLFPVSKLDESLRVIGGIACGWYVLTWIFYYLKKE